MNTNNTQGGKAEAFLYHLVDKVWNVVTESEEVPDPQWSQQIISDARKSFDEKRTLELLKACEISPPAQPSVIGERREEERIGTASEFIDRAVAMLKEQYEDKWLVAGYNGIVSLLSYAKTKINRMDAENKELDEHLGRRLDDVEKLQSQLTRLREENEKLQTELNNLKK